MIDQTSITKRWKREIWNMETMQIAETEATNEMTVLTGGRRGRKADTTPNKKFNPVKVMDNGDGTAVYKVQWNDRNGKRCSKLETMKCERKVRKGSDEALKVFTIKQERVESSNNIALAVPYNDQDGVRCLGSVVLSVTKNGKLSAKIA